jgi:hypothetical protein
VPARFFTGGPCAHTICLAADIEVLKGVHGADLAEVVSRLALARHPVNFPDSC